MLSKKPLHFPGLHLRPPVHLLVFAVIVWIYVGPAYCHTGTRRIITNGQGGEGEGNKHKEKYLKKGSRYGLSIGQGVRNRRVLISDFLCHHRQTLNPPAL